MSPARSRGFSRRAGPLLLAAFAVLLAGPALPQSEGRGREGPGSAAVRAVVRPGEPRQGQLFNVEIRARRLRDAGAVAFHLVYDPDLVEPVPSGFSEGPVLRRRGASTSFLAAPASTGDRVMVGIARLGRSDGARGGGLLCKLSFRALKAGPVTFAFDRARLTAPDASRRPAGFHPGRAEIVPTRPGRKGVP